MKINKKNRKRLTVILVAALVILIAIAIILSRVTYSNNGEGNERQVENEGKAGNVATSDSAVNISLGDGLNIISTDAYTGPYWEDGSYEEVSDIQMILLENVSEQNLQYAEITVEHKDCVAEYAVTNLPAGAKAVVLEKNRMEYTKKAVVETSVENTVFLEEMPLYENIFEIQGLDGVINVKNISEKDITGDIYIYYKNLGDGVYHGGITYRVRVEGGLQADEIRQLGASHYNAENCEILMVSYVE